MSDRTPRFVITGLMVYDGDRAPLNDRPTPEIEKFEKYVPAWAHAHTPSRAAQTAERRAAVARGAPSRVRPRARPPVTMEPPASTAPLADVSNDGAPRVPAQHAVLDKPASEIRAPPPSASPTPTAPADAAAASLEPSGEEFYATSWQPGYPDEDPVSIKTSRVSGQLEVEFEAPTVSAMLPDPS